MEAIRIYEATLSVPEALLTVWQQLRVLYLYRNPEPEAPIAPGANRVLQSERRVFCRLVADFLRENGIGMRDGNMYSPRLLQPHGYIQKKPEPLRASPGPLQHSWSEIDTFLSELHNVVVPRITRKPIFESQR